MASLNPPTHALSKQDIDNINILMDNLNIGASKPNPFITQVVKIQSWIRMKLINRKLLIPSSKYQTKVWRKTRDWYSNGKSNECECYQIKMVERITKLNLIRTSDRIHMESLSIINKKYPLKDIDGFEYTENFDGVQHIGKCKVYYNLKFVCDAGGAQTRSLREVYHFLKCQLKVLLTSNNIYFINILDGDTSYKSMNKYLHLIDSPEYSAIKKNIFIGDLAMFQSWWPSCI